MRPIDADAYKEELCGRCGAECTNSDNEYGPCSEVRLLNEQPTILQLFTEVTTSWIRCADKMPSDCRYVIAFNVYDGRPVLAWYDKILNVWRDNANDDIEYDVGDITHWKEVDLTPPNME